MPGVGGVRPLAVAREQALVAKLAPGMRQARFDLDRAGERTDRAFGVAGFSQQCSKLCVQHGVAWVRGRERNENAPRFVRLASRSKCAGKDQQRVWISR